MQGCAQQDVKIRGLHTSEFLYFLHILGLRKLPQGKLSLFIKLSNTSTCCFSYCLYVFRLFTDFCSCLTKFNITRNQMTFSKSEQTFTNTKLWRWNTVYSIKNKSMMPSGLDILIHSELLFSKFPDTSYTAILPLPFFLSFLSGIKVGPYLFTIQFLQCFTSPRETFTICCNTFD